LRKDHAIIQANGSIDELSSYLGLISALMQELSHAYPAFSERIEQLTWCQNALFGVSGMIAFLSVPNARPLVTNHDIVVMEQWLNALQTALPQLTQFVLPGGSVLASHIHIARTICRRAERDCVTITLDSASGEPDQTVQLPPVVIPFLNRLSDYLFLLARWVLYETGETEQLLPSKHPQ
jgi:cob(I)alamin adenosyltransferase